MNTVDERNSEKYSDREARRIFGESTLDDIQTALWQLQSEMVEDGDISKRYEEKLKHWTIELEEIIAKHGLWGLSSDE